MTGIEKATIIMQRIDMQITTRNKQIRKILIEAITEGLEQIEAMEPTRTLAEVQSIVDAVRAGVKVQIDYADTEDMEEDNDVICKACW